MPLSDKKFIHAYACKVDFDYHFGADAFGCRIYFSLDSIQHHSKCCKGCGIVSFLIDPSTAKVIQEENEKAQYANSKTMDEWIEIEQKEMIEDLERAKKRLKRNSAALKRRGKRKKIK